jgi:hypothetical protein
VQTKIEVTPVLRGCVYERETRAVSDPVEAQFGFAEIPVVSFADLYAGEIVAALDRQHPRDLLDVKDLLANEGIDDALRKAFIVYLLSHERSLAARDHCRLPALFRREGGDHGFDAVGHMRRQSVVLGLVGLRHVFEKLDNQILAEYSFFIEKSDQSYQRDLLHLKRRECFSNALVQIGPIAAKISQRCRQASISRTALQTVENLIHQIEDWLRQKKPRIERAELSRLKAAAVRAGAKAGRIEDESDRTRADPARSPSPRLPRSSPSS